jgi:hypothetical protein
LITGHLHAAIPRQCRDRAVDLRGGLAVLRADDRVAFQLARHEAIVGILAGSAAGPPSRLTSRLTVDASRRPV